MFQSRYRAASHFRFNEAEFRQVVRPTVSISLSSGFSFQVGVIFMSLGSYVDVSISLSSGFSFQVRFCTSLEPICTSCKFQSRYRAASHFRCLLPLIKRTSVSVSISLSSGFSFQACFRLSLQQSQCRFNLVIERLLISGCVFRSRQFQVRSFNLVIERLLISGRSVQTVGKLAKKPFQSRYRAASHFRCG